MSVPTVEVNKAAWDGDYNWTNRGDEWSAKWGGPYMQWYGSLLPRIASHLPTDNILEIACGYGRWTQYLKDLCNRLVVIDLSAECIQACKQRFSNSSHIEYHVNDGKCLDMISDSSVDFVFSFDSLVHADESVMDAYLSQFPRILKKDGVVVIHHSNLGEYRTRYSRIRRIPKLEGALIRLGMLESAHWRDPSVDAEKVESLAEKHGLRCISQELIPWLNKRTFIDCVSTIVKGDSSIVRSNRVMKNAVFAEEAQNLRQLSQLYDPSKR